MRDVTRGTEGEGPFGPQRWLLRRFDCHSRAPRLAPMARKRATITAAGPGLRFVAGTASGHAVLFDNEEGDSAARPMEVLLAALGACSAMDVLSIMRKKAQPIGFYHVRVEGEQRDEHPRVYTEIRVVHEVEGAGIDVSALKRAIELSAGR